MSSYLPVLSYSTAGADGGSKSANPSRPTKTRGRAGNGKVRSRKSKIKSLEPLPADQERLGISSSATTTSTDDVVERDSKCESVQSTRKSYAQALRFVKKAVVAVQLALLEGAGTDVQLRCARALLTQAEYGDVVIERSIVDKCGLPTCPDPLAKQQQRKGRYRVSLQEHKVYDLTEMNLFCSPGCLIKSSTFSSTLRAERDVLVSKEELLSVVKQVRGSCLSGAQETVKTSAIVERPEEKVIMPGSFGPSDAVEGYVPQKGPEPLEAAGILQENVEAAGMLQVQNSFEFQLPGSSGPSDAIGDHIPEETSEPVEAAGVLQMENSFDFHSPGSFGPPSDAIEGDTPDGNPEPVEAAGILQVENSLDFNLPGSSGSPDAMEGYVPEKTTGPIEAAGILQVEKSFDFHKFDDALFTAETGSDFEGVAQLDDFDASDSCYDETPAGFKTEVSRFGSIWGALFEWISAASVAHIYGKENLDCVAIHGIEYMRKKVTHDGLSADIARTVATCLARQLPHVTMALRISVPISTLEQAVGRLVQTMTFVRALPSFGVKEWRMLATLFVDALSVQRLPMVSAHLENNRALLRQTVESSGISEVEYSLFREILLPAGRLPTFSTQSGG